MNHDADYSGSGYYVGSGILFCIENINYANISVNVYTDLILIKCLGLWLYIGFGNGSGSVIKKGFYSYHPSSVIDMDVYGLYYIDDYVEGLLLILYLDNAIYDADD